MEQTQNKRTSKTVAYRTMNSKISDYIQFTKLRLSLLVVFSAAVCFAFGSETMDWTKFLLLILGGFLVTASSNGFNQIIEKETDKLMTRTANRPLPQERMTNTEAYFIASVMGIAGVLILFKCINPLSGILGLTALLLYTFAYTPLKKVTPFAVFVGAFPGAIPPLIGFVATTADFGHISLNAWILFAIQFIWQFPHFWAIAWVVEDDYRKAGFKMLPSEGGRDKSSAFQILMYSLSLIPISLLAVFFKMTGNIATVILILSGAAFAFQAYKLFNDCSIKSASRLMFASFIYLPIVQIAILMDKI